MRQLNIVLFFIGFLMPVLAYQNCGGGFKSVSQKSQHFSSDARSSDEIFLIDNNSSFEEPLAEGVASTPHGDTVPPPSEEPEKTPPKDPNFIWQTSHFTNDKYPQFEDPLIINTQKQLEAYQTRYPELPPGSTGKSMLFPAGQIYSIRPTSPNKDVIFDARNLTIEAPLKITEARHVWVIGGKWITKFEQKGAPGMLANVGRGNTRIPGANLYPRVVGGSMLQISNSHTLIIEGVDMDANGHNNDAIVTNTIIGQTPQHALANKRMYLLNSRIRGYSGHVANYIRGGPNGGPLGDGVHADAFQYQSETAHQELIFENIVVHSGQEGMVSTSTNVQANRTVYSKYKALYDKRFVDGDRTHWSYIAPIGSNPRFLTLEECYFYRTQVYNPSSNALGTNENHLLYWFGDKRMYFTDGNGSGWGNAGYGDKDTAVPSGMELDMSTWEPTPYNVNAFTSVVRHAGITTISGSLKDGDDVDPPGTDFAPANQVGHNYRTNEKLY